MNLDRQQFNIAVEGEAATVLAHFDDNFILDIIMDNMNRRANTLSSIPNIVSAMESQFQLMNEVYPHELDSIKERRDKIYSNIILIICRYNNLAVLDMDSIHDKYSTALYLYDIFISNFKNYLVEFFSNFINKERNTLFNALNLGDLKRRKDTSTAYGKKSYKNQKIAVINANLEAVLNFVFSYNISFADLMNYMNIQQSVSRHILMTVAPMGDAYRELYVMQFSNPMHATSLLTDIRLAIHKSSIIE